MTFEREGCAFELIILEVTRIHHFGVYQLRAQRNRCLETVAAVIQLTGMPSGNKLIFYLDSEIEREFGLRNKQPIQSNNLNKSLHNYNFVMIGPALKSANLFSDLYYQY